MLQDPLSKSLPWERNRASAIPLSRPPPHPLPPAPTNPFVANPLSRPGVSARLSAITAFSRHASRSPSPSVPFPDANSTDQRVDMQNHHPNPPSRSTSQSGGARPSSRRALTAALELAQEAVRLDTTNDDPIGAIHAYSRSVALLSEVMERVMRGEDASDTGRRRGGRRRSVVAKEEEVRRLKSIHDTYADRMNILSDIYNVDPNNPDAPIQEELSTASDNGMRASSLTEASIEAATDESFDGTEFIGSAMLAPSRESTSTPDSSRTGSDNTFTTDNSLPEFEMVQPPSLQQFGQAPSFLPSVPPLGVTGSSTSSRVSVLPPPRPPPSGPLPTRPRNGSLSSLPPPAPPPRVAPPPPPPNSSEPGEPAARTTSLLPPVSTRPRGNSSAHKRTGSGSRLEALQEEPDLRSASRNRGTTSGGTYSRQPHDPALHPRHYPVDEDDYRATIIRPPSQYLVAPQAHPPPPAKEAPPLPPIPTSATPPPQNPTAASAPSSPTPHASPMTPTPRGNAFINQPHPFAAQDAPPHAQRPRGISAPTSRADAYPQPAQLMMINSNTSAGTISQRRSKSSTGTVSSQSSSRSSPPGTAVPQPGMSPPQTLPVVRLTSATLPASTANSLGMGRSRSISQPPRPALMGTNSSPSEFGVRSSGPSHNFSNAQGILPRKTSFPSRLNPATQTLGASGASPQPPSASSHLPSSPLPPAPPPDPLRKPYHLMSLLRITMTSKTGGYITRRLHVPQEVWSQGGAKLLNLPEKVRVVEVLCGALEEVQNASNEFKSGTGVAFPGGRKDFERWLAKLEEWSGACEGVVGNVGKKLGVGGGFGAKKSGGVTSWSNKFARSLDRMTNGKNSLDSPASYVSGLTRLFQQAQLLDEHTKALNTSPASPLYASLPADMRQALELKLKQSSEFFASVVLTFVVRDLSQLLDKYVKKGEKWLAE